MATLQPEALVRELDELRMTKSAYEIACLREANRLAVAGHQAANAAFIGAAAELDVQLAYLAASRQRESEVTYQNIIGLNEHAGVLHYQHYVALEFYPENHHTFLDVVYPILLFLFLRFPFFFLPVP